MRLEIELRCILFLLIILGVSSTWLESNCGKHNCLYKVPPLTIFVSKNKAMRSKELSVELWDRIVSRYRSGEGKQKISAALKVPKKTGASINIKWKLGTTKTVLRAGRPGKLSNRATRAIPSHFIWPDLGLNSSLLPTKLSANRVPQERQMVT
jgi:hypothetical protein